MTPLIRAAFSASDLAIKELLEKGADVHAKDDGGKMAIHWAAYDERSVCADILISNGADINAQDDNGMTPLSCACDSGSPEVAKLLISHGADLHQTDFEDDQTPLFFACGRNNPPEKLKELIAILVSSGAEVNARDVFKSTPLHTAAYHGVSAAVESLISHGADVHAVEGVGCTGGTSDFHGMTPILYAAYGSFWSAFRSDRSNLESIGVLLSHGADVNAVTEEGLTPLHIICLNGHWQAGSQQITETAKRLIRNGANVNALSGPSQTANWPGYTELLCTERRTPLHYACIRGHMALVQVLAQHGADFTILDKDGKTALELTPDSDKDTVQQIIMFQSEGEPPSKRRCQYPL